MGEIINLNRFRKLRDKQAGEAKASANRMQSGISKLEKSRLSAQRQREKTHLDGHVLEKPPLDDIRLDHE